MAGRRVKLARGPALKGSCKLLPADAEALAGLIREWGHGRTAKRLKVSPALVDKLSDGGAALPESVSRMKEALSLYFTNQTRIGAPGEIPVKSE